MHAALGSLLKILHKAHPELPKDSPALLNRGVASSALAMQNMADGSYGFFGQKRVSFRLLLNNASTMILHVNIDGLRLQHSTNVRFGQFLVGW